MMAKITKELLRKYDSRTCTEQEKEQVQEWLYSDSMDDEIDHSLLSEEDFEKEKDAIWAKLNETIAFPEAGHQHKESPVRIRVIRYAAAACLILAMVASGYFLAFPDSPSGIAFFDTQEKGALHISSGQGNTTKIAGSRYNIHFNGVLRLYNASESQMTIICGNKTFDLKSRETYYLKGSEKSAGMIRASSLGIKRDFERLLRGTFTVKVSRT